MFKNKATIILHGNVVPRSTMNTNGETENSLCSVNLSAY